MSDYVELFTGDPAPFFKQATRSNDRFHFDTVGGRYLILGLMGEDNTPAAQSILDVVGQRRGFFDDAKAAFFGVVTTPVEKVGERTKDSMPGVRFFFDEDLTISRLYGGSPTEGDASAYRPRWVVVDPGFNVVDVIPVDESGAHIARLHRTLDRLPPVDAYLGLEMHPPIIVVPNVLEKDFCNRLVDLYKTHGGEDSGFMRQIDGKTVGLVDYGHKRRRDFTIDDDKLIQAVQSRFIRRVVPAIQKAHQFGVTRMERYIVACYSGHEKGHFRPHRDNTTKGTAHRRFATTINLNSDFEGGEISFPEFGPRRYKPPPGAALIFSCSILHTVSPVIRGDRYAFLPFLYDDAAADIRRQNLEYLESQEERDKPKLD